MLAACMFLPFSEAFAQSNRAPVIRGAPATSIEADKSYSFQPQASDPEGKRLTFSIKNKPSWASFSTSTGKLSGKPGTSHVGKTSKIAITVSDGKLKAALPGFTINVKKPKNQPPKVSGKPATQATVGKAYRFKPTGSDPEKQKITWSISGKPSGSKFDVKTGQLDWTPTSTGTAAKIVIRATDTQGASTALPAFSIKVASSTAKTTASAKSSATAALSWSTPAHYANGDPLPQSKLAGFRIYSGSSSGSLKRIAEVDGRTTNLTVNNLGKGTHYFAVTALIADGSESPYSAIVSKKVP